MRVNEKADRAEAIADGWSAFLIIEKYQASRKGTGG